MRKTLSTMFLFVLCIFAGCGTNKITSEKEIESQVLVASNGNLESKKDLLLLPELSADGLVALCQNLNPVDLIDDENDINAIVVQRWFTDAIKRIDLSPEQEVKIAELGIPTYNRALLIRTNLSSEGLVFICKYPGFLDFSSYSIQNIFKDAIERTDLSSEEEAEIAELCEPVYNKALILKNHTGDPQYITQMIIASQYDFGTKKALLLSPQLSADGLVALCQNPTPLGIEHSTVEKWFSDAIKRTDLSPEQEVELAKQGEFAYIEPLLLKTNLSPEGLVAICTYQKNLNLDNDTVQDLLKDAFERTDLTSKQEIEIAELGEPVYTKALLLRTNLSADGLIAICKNPGNLDLDNEDIKKLFSDAIERTKLN